MASKFTLTSGSYKGRYMELVCTQTKNIATNKSTISWTLSSIGGENNYYSTGPTTVTINGTQVYYKGRVNYEAKTFPAAKGSTSGTIEVSHTGDGSKAISVSMSTAIYTGTVSTYSGTWTLDSIPRQANITSAPDFTDLDNPTITYSNPAGNAVTALDACISFTGAKDDVAYRAISKTGTIYQFPLTDAERNLLRNNTTGPNRTVLFYVRTKIGSNTFYSTASKTFAVTETDDTRPTVTMTATLNNGTLPSAFDGLYIQGKSRVDATLSAEGKYSASIKSHSVSIDGKTYSSTGFTSDVIQGSGSMDIVGTAKDSREFTGSAEQTINVIEYSKPLVIPIGSENAILCYRSDGNGNRTGNSTSLWVKAARSYYNVSQKNHCSLEWRRKLVAEAWNDNDHEWHDLIPVDAIGDEYNALIQGEVFDLKKSYTVQIRAIDDIGEYDLRTFEIPTQDVALHLGKGGKNVSVGTYCDYSEEYTFYSEWKAIFDKDVVIGGLPVRNHVVEEGVDGIWRYRKWADGTAECRGVHEQSNVAISNAWGNLFESKGYEVDLPSGLFVETPQFSITLLGSNGVMTEIFTLGSAEKSPKICAIRPFDLTIETLRTSIVAYGRWK